MSANARTRKQHGEQRGCPIRVASPAMSRRVMMSSSFDTYRFRVLLAVPEDRMNWTVQVGCLGDGRGRSGVPRWVGREL